MYAVCVYWPFKWGVKVGAILAALAFLAGIVTYAATKGKR